MAAAGAPRQTPSPVPYRPRSPEEGVLHQVVRAELESFLDEVRRRSGGAGVPGFVERELREFITCGHPARGFARFRCDGCRLERLVPFSCKGRGWCPSCTGRRMNERAAHFVDDVLGGLPVRQWVLTVPHRLRYLMAFDHELCRAVLGVFVRALLGGLRQRARDAGVCDGRGGTVTAIQRCGSALGTNVHFHTLVADGVFAGGEGEELTFHALPPPSDGEVARLLDTVRRRVLRLLHRRGLLADDDPAPGPAGEPSALAGITAAAVLGRAATGARAGARLRRLGARSRGPLDPSPRPAPRPRRRLRPPRRPRRRGRRQCRARAALPIRPQAPGRPGAPLAARRR